MTKRELILALAALPDDAKIEVWFRYGIESIGGFKDFLGTATEGDAFTLSADITDDLIICY